MFTGIVRELGRIVSLSGGEEGVRLEIDAPCTAPGVEIGGSVAINGVCLTAESVEAPRLTFHTVPETLRRTTLGSLAAGSAVNLEPALRAGDAMGGHFVQGHVDGVGTVRSSGGPEGAWVLSLAAPAEVLRNLIPKGSVGVDGVSLTVATLEAEGLTIALVPHTLSVTTLGALKKGDRVNLEADMLGKWVRKLMEEAGTTGPVSSITRASLEAEGFA